MASEIESLDTQTAIWLRSHKSQIKEALPDYDEHQILLNTLKSPNSLAGTWAGFVQAVAKLGPPQGMLSELGNIGAGLEGARSSISESDRNALIALVDESQKLGADQRSQLLDRWLDESKVSPRVLTKMRGHHDKVSGPPPVEHSHGWFHRCAFCGAAGLGTCPEAPEVGVVLCILCAVFGRD